MHLVVKSKVYLSIWRQRLFTKKAGNALYFKFWHSNVIMDDTPTDS